MGRLSDQIRHVILGSGIGRYRIAKETGVAQSTLSRFMAGEGGLTLETLDRLGERLGMALTTKAPKTKRARHHRRRQ